MVFEFSGFVIDALVMASYDDMVEMCMAIMGCDWGSKLHD